MTEHGNFQLRAAPDTTARGNSTAVDNASHVVARHKTAATSRAAMCESCSGWQRFQRLDPDSSAADIAAHAHGNKSI
jgi:hypothetical protein